MSGKISYTLDRTLPDQGPDEVADGVADGDEPRSSTARVPRELRGGYTQAELALVRDAAGRAGADLEARSFVVPDVAVVAPGAAPRPEVADVLRNLERVWDVALTGDQADDHAGNDTVDMSSLTAEATAAEIAAATARARAALDDVADAASQNAAEPTADEALAGTRAADDEWHYLRTRRPAETVDELAVYDTTTERDDAYDAAWDATDSGDDVGAVLAAGDD